MSRSNGRGQLNGLKVGIDFLWTDEGNTGRVNYIYSLVNALATLPCQDQPELVVFHLADSPIDRLRKTGYSRLRFQVLVDGCIPQFTFGRKLVNRLSRVATGQNAMPVLKPVPAGMVDCVIPCEHREVFHNVSRRIHWIVDFNCYHLPHLFPGDSLRGNREHIEQIVALDEELMFSSQDSVNDFRAFFPGAANKTHILRFAVGLPEVVDVPKSDLLAKYGIREPYFITPNTFWAHKNHQVLIRAMKRCVEHGHKLDLVLTGKQVTYQGDAYSREIHSLVETMGLHERVHFLGLVDRQDQVALMKNATAIVQPSKFEGWSTVVEEAKALRVPLIVSDIPIHREQVGDPYGMFPPDDDNALSNLMISVCSAEAVPPNRSDDYRHAIKSFGQAIASIVSARRQHPALS